ncbi:hypothetical protein AGOR_G00004770 [Albula goreensis]|uniref:Myocardial zonula adherens protein n=1 Tax=Albula goreensis TaxID=1534307 RepID=A0A8T3E532_9TELE|nr:hypothetical protein AGOR_G00004770 [Albula goreensis]
MLKYSSGGTVITTADTKDSSSERNIRRLRLTLHPGDSVQDAAKKVSTDTMDKAVSGSVCKKNGYVQQVKPAGCEPGVQNLTTVTNGIGERLAENGPKVYGVVQRTGTDCQQELMAYEWPVSHLRDEMRYIREVRDSLEKVRERMYGQFGSMQQSMKKLSQEMRTSNAQRRSLESEVRVRTKAMDSFDQINSSLISSNIDLQKIVLEKCSDRVQIREELKSLRTSYEQAEEKLKEREQQLAAARVENDSLRLQVETTEEGSSKRLQEMTLKLQSEYEERLQQEQRKHLEEIEALQVKIADYERRIEEAERNVRIAEAKIAERDQRIIEVERLLDCMGKEKGQLQQKLQECELRLRKLEQTDHMDATTVKKSQKLEEEASELRERIKHLNDMVFSQQRKVKGMVEEVETLRAKVAQKDMFISELLDRIAIIECENNELEDKVEYFMSEQNGTAKAMSTRDIGVGCDLSIRPEIHPENSVGNLFRPFRSTPAPPTRVDSTLLRAAPSLPVQSQDKI